MDDAAMTHGLAEVVELMADAPHWWAIGGGWAVDLHVGAGQRRPHKDVDLICLADEADLVREHLAGWDLHRVITGEFEPWIGSLAPAHQIWARPDPVSPWAFEVLFEQTDRATWRFRREPSVTLARDRMRTDLGGIPTIHLGMALLYKAKRDDDQDMEDLLACLPVMEQSDRTWLADAVSATHGEAHRWVPALRAG